MTEFSSLIFSVEDLNLLSSRLLGTKCFAIENLMKLRCIENLIFSNLQNIYRFTYICLNVIRYRLVVYTTTSNDSNRKGGNKSAITLVIYNLRSRSIAQRNFTLPYVIIIRLEETRKFKIQIYVKSWPGKLRHIL